MTIAEAPVSAGTSSRGWMPAFSKLRAAATEAVALAAVTFVLGGVTEAVLWSPVNQYLVPAVLDIIGSGQRLNLYEQDADGTVKLDACYKLLEPPWSSSGRMVEILDPNVCPPAKEILGNKLEDHTPNLFKTVGTTSAGIKSFVYNHLDDRYGGGTFTGDAKQGPGVGVYVGELVGQGHNKVGDCVLRHYWAVVGDPERVPTFQDILEARLKAPSDQASEKSKDDQSLVALLARPISHGGCGENKQTAAQVK